MNKYTSKLLSLFLVLGIIFFGLTLYMFYKEEFSNDKIISTVSLEKVRILKNNLANSKLIDSLNNFRESEQYYGIREKNNNVFIFTCMNDKLIYAKTNKFNIKTIETPESITFTDISIIPKSVLNNEFKLQLIESNKTIIDFKVVNLFESLNLKEKCNNLSEQKEIKLESIDKSIVVFLFFDLNVVIK